MHRIHDRNHDRTGGRRTAVVDITVLGAFRVTVDGVPTASRGWARRTAASLVKILALTPGHHLHREKVMDLLWPDESPESSAPKLHKAAHFARKASGRDDAVVLRDDIVWLFPDAELTVDAVRFEELARAAVAGHDPQLAREALGVYGGELLPGDSYEDWAADRRELLALRRLDVLRVAGEWRDLVELDPTDEEARTHLMRRHLAAGDGASALREYEHLTQVLERELGVAPGEPARQAGQEAHRLTQRAATATATHRADQLLAELSDLVRRQHVLLAELATVGGRAPSIAC